VPVDLCSVSAIKTYVASIYGTSEEVGCTPSERHDPGEAPPAALDNWYFPGIPNSGNAETTDGRVEIEISSDHTKYKPEIWEESLKALQTSPNIVQDAGTVNGVPALWVRGEELLTPYGAADNLTVHVWSDLEGNRLPASMNDAKKLAELAESGAFR
jgi:hypothetical protein